MSEQARTANLAQSLGGKVGGHVEPGPDGSLYEWWCTDCTTDGEEPTREAAGLALYEHRQRAHSGRTDSTDEVGG